MTKTIGAKHHSEGSRVDRLVEKLRQQADRDAAKKPLLLAAQREKSLEKVKKEAARYRSMRFITAKWALLVALDRSQPLRLIFVARYLGQGPHKEELADLLRIEFAGACYAGDNRKARRTQEALGALLQKERPFFTCNCDTVELPCMPKSAGRSSAQGSYFTVINQAAE